MKLMTVTYPNGTVLKAILLSHDEHEIRAIAEGCDDVLAFTRIHGIWISEEIEPVTIEFEWQRRRASHLCTGDDCTYPKELAGLLSTLLRCGERDEAVASRLYVLDAEDTGVAVPGTTRN